MGPWIAPLALFAPLLQPPSAQSCEENAAVQVVGAATPGSAGLLTLGMGGAPVVGSSFHLQVAHALAGAPGLVAHSPNEQALYLPQFAATIYVGDPLRGSPFDVGLDGVSPPLLPLAPVPVDLCGLELVAQAVVQDPLAAGGFAFTQAVRLAFGASEAGVAFPGATFPAGSSPRSLVLGDFNGDAVADAAVANACFDCQSIKILLGVGDGAFRSGRILETVEQVLSLAAGDLDADGRLDLVAASYPSFIAPGRLFVFLGRGDGTFLPAGEWPAGDYTWGLAIGDTGVDGIPDVVIGNNDALTVLVGAGDGAFLGHLRLPTGGGTHAVGIGDFDGDLVPDLVAANSTSEPLQGSVSVFLGAGDGTFLPALDAPAKQFMDDLALGYLDADDHLDLVVPGGQGYLQVYLGKGDGTFMLPLVLFVDGSPKSVAIGDLDGDSLLDLALADEDQDQVEVWMGDGTGAFSGPATFPGASNTASVRMADLDGDQRLDVVAAAPGISTSEGGGVVVLPGLGDGSLLGAKTQATEDLPRDVAMADFDGDSDLDLALAQDGSCDCYSIFLGTGDASFVALPSQHGLSEARSIAVGDWNQDLIPDLAVGVNALDQVRLFLGQGDGLFAPGAILPVGDGPADVAVADLDADQMDDLVVASGNGFSGSLAILLGLPDGTFVAAPSVPTGTNPGSIAVGDLNADQIVDLAVGLLEPDSIAIYLGLGGGTFAASTNYAAGEDPYVALADLDADLILDLVAGTTEGLYVFPGSGDGSFGPATIYGVNGNWPLIDDFNGDLRPDVLLVGGFNLVALLLGQDSGQLGAPLRFAVDNNAISGAAGDLNGDLVPDVVTTNRTQDSLSILTNLLLDQAP